MTTTHEFDAHCDTQHFAEPDYHELIVLMHEFEESREEALQRQGAIATLKDLRSYLLRYRPVHETNDVTRGLRWAITAIEIQIKQLDGTFVPLPLTATTKGGVL